MQNDILMALLLDPFMTFAEAEKEFRVASVAARTPPRESHPPTPPRRPTGAIRRPVRATRGVPVLHHPPAVSG